MTKKRKGHSHMTAEVKEQIRNEFRLGARVNELARKYGRDKSNISRLVNKVGRDGEKLANKLATVNQEIATYSQHEQEVILQRSEQILKIKETTIKGTRYITARTLRKLQSMKDNQVNFNDLSQAQRIMVKADALVDPKPKNINEVNVNAQINNVEMSKQQVHDELKKENIPIDLLTFLEE